jgi:hypothetical protein
MTDLAIRIDHIEDDVREHKGKLSEIEDRIDIHADTIRAIDQWRKGNGAQGAEGRLQCTEAVLLDYQVSRAPERLNAIEADIGALQKIADGRISAAIGESVRTTLDARDRTAIAYLKAFGPYAATIAALAAAILAGIK